MKRHRVFSFSFDSRPIFVAESFSSDSTVSGHPNGVGASDSTEQSIAAEFGTSNYEAKRKNFASIGALPFTIISFHTHFLVQARNAFVIGAYYPALTGACSLGERILNHLVLALRDDYSAHPATKRVERVASVSNWKAAIDALTGWEILLPDVRDAFLRLSKIRNRSVHFTQSTDSNSREQALEALHLITTIVAKQFSAFGPEPWFIEGAVGESYIKRDWETNPFIRKVYLPCCKLVGPLHEIQDMGPPTLIVDAPEYPDIDLTDKQFLEVRAHRNEFKPDDA